MANADISILSKINPAPGYVLIEPEEQKTQTASGIYLPDNAKGDKPQQGKVVAVGSDIVSKESTSTSPAKKGNTVIYKKWGGNDVKLDNKDYMFVKFEDILATLG